MKILEQFYNDYEKLFELALYDNRKKKYKRKNISKKSGGKRRLLIPPETTDKLQKKLNRILQTIYNAPNSVHAFIKSKENEEKKSIVSNAKQHVKKQIVINIDIKDFFDTINFGRVRGIFLAKPISLDETLATKFAQLISYDNKLPQGASTSPIISNIICKKMDHNLIQFSKKHSLTYSRYADDITFSTHKNSLDTDFILNEIEKIIVDNGFEINTLKTRIQLANQSQVVTGLKVNQKVNVPRKYIRQVRSMLYSWKTEGIEEASKKHFKSFNNQTKKYIDSKEESFKNIVLGKINFIGQVKGTDDLNYIRFYHTYYLLDSSFSLKEKLDYFEHFDFYNMQQDRAKLLLTQIYDSLLVFTEGVTDIIYIKEALKFFKNKKMFTSLNLRYSYFGGYADVIKMHRILYDEHIVRMSKLNELDIANIRKCILPNIDKSLKFCFVLDADEIAIEKHFEKHDYKNHFLLDLKNKGYIEKLLDKELIKKIIKKYGFKIDVNRKEFSEKTKTELNKYMKIKNKYSNISAVSNYIAYGVKIIEKTNLAKFISNKDDVDYSKFEDLFCVLEKINHNFRSPKQLCCQSLY
ncbi:RNA-directed DNA polymerase [Sulfurovum sp. enrichment culture clone C5]|uniref:RNA-directed DNA polymerase n=1 Tax=Sulfurovum sp. enrichment culture clone C5 TaxID=497650 RepID=A0A0S4XNC9_9BACT|nr:RNA-directed DNA polymerase [Sulfurovum sp. enrichment culture clone C5]